MSNMLYNKARELFLTGGIDWMNDTFKVQLVDTGNYTVSAAHQFLSDIPANARIHDPTTLSGKTATDGAADATDTLFTAVAAGTSIEAIVIYRESGAEGSNHLIAYIDTATGLPITPNGGDIIITWDNGVNKIFRV